MRRKVLVGGDVGARQQLHSKQRVLVRDALSNTPWEGPKGAWRNEESALNPEGRPCSWLGAHFKPLDSRRQLRQERELRKELEREAVCNPELVARRRDV